MVTHVVTHVVVHVTSRPRARSFSGSSAQLDVSSFVRFLTRSGRRFLTSFWTWGIGRDNPLWSRELAVLLFGPSAPRPGPRPRPAPPQPCRERTLRQLTLSHQTGELLSSENMPNYTSKGPAFSPSPTQRQLFAVRRSCFSLAKVQLSSDPKRAHRVSRFHSCETGPKPVEF